MRGGRTHTVAADKYLNDMLDILSAYKKFYAASLVRMHLVYDTFKGGKDDLC